MSSVHISEFALISATKPHKLTVNCWNVDVGKQMYIPHQVHIAIMIGKNTATTDIRLEMFTQQMGKEVGPTKSHQLRGFVKEEDLVVILTLVMLNKLRCHAHF